MIGFKVFLQDRPSEKLLHTLVALPSRILPPREVTGYVLISHVDVRRIVLPSLQIVRGRTLFKLNVQDDEFALIVTLSKMHNLEMPALRGESFSFSFSFSSPLPPPSIPVFVPCPNGRTTTGSDADHRFPPCSPPPPPHYTALHSNKVHYTALYCTELH